MNTEEQVAHIDNSELQLRGLSDVPEDNSITRIIIICLLRLMCAFMPSREATLELSFLPLFLAEVNLNENSDQDLHNKLFYRILDPRRTDGLDPIHVRSWKIPLCQSIVL